MKKYITAFILFIFLMFGFIQRSFADELFKINSANFDISSSVISLTSNSLTEIPEFRDFKVIKLSNPTRLYFDIPGAVLQGAKKDWVFTTDGIKEIKISQFSTTPAIVRVVVNYDDNFDISNLEFVSLKNGIFVKLKGDIAQNPFMQNIYRDDHSSSNDFYEYMTVSSVMSPATNDTIARIDNAFNNTDEKNVSQEIRLNTKYYVDKLNVSPGMVTINGIGSAAIEKPMILTNPMRIVFDLPNTLVNRNIRNKEYNMNANESVRIGQFSVNKARIVITTDNVTKYIPVYSKDAQVLLLTNIDNVGKIKISGQVNLNRYLNTKIDDLSSAMTLYFDTPIVHGFDRTNSEVIAYLYNVQDADIEKFNTTFSNTAFSKAKLEKAERGYKLSIPIEHDSLVTTFMGMDGKSLKFQIKAPRDITQITQSQPETKTPVNMPVSTDGKYKVVIDAGHGGTDVGANRNGTYEKYITLDVAKRIEKALKAQGYGVLMTRSDDSYVSLQDRVAFSEEYSPNIFVSIHVNASTSDTPNGIETHYYHQESIPLAQTVHSSLASKVKANNRGTFKSKFYVINHTTAPAILIEIGFISNTEERGQLCTNERKQNTADAIVEGINNYFKSIQQ